MNINEAVERLTKAGYVAEAQNDGVGVIKVQDIEDAIDDSTVFLESLSEREKMFAIMLAFPSMLCSAADAAGIKYPEDVNADYNKDEFPHWFILCATQLCRPCRPEEHFHNAVVIAGLSVDKIKTMDYAECEELGIV